MNEADNVDPESTPATESQAESGSADSFPSAGENRIRPGLKAMAGKLFLGLLAVGLLPKLLALLLIWPQLEHSRQSHEDWTRAYQQLQTQVTGLETALKTSGEQQAQFTAEKDLLHKERSWLRDREKLVGGLAGLVRDKPAEEIAASAEIKKLLRTPGGFLLAALVDPAAKSIVRSKTKKAPANHKQLIAELKTKFTSMKSATAVSADSWSWVKLPGSSLYAAFRAPAWEQSASKSQQDLGPAISAKDGAPNNATSNSFSDRLVLLSIVLPLLVLILSFIAFSFFRKKLLHPLAQVTGFARQVLDDPNRTNPDDLAAAGLLEDLSASLARLNTRMQRMHEQDKATIERHFQISDLLQVLSRTATGDLSVRAETKHGECEELALSFNRFLDQHGERFQALHQAGHQLQAASKRLQVLAQKTAGALHGSVTEKPADYSVLGDFLGSEIDQLCNQSMEMAAGFEPNALPSWTAHDGEQMLASLETIEASLLLLSQRTNQLHKTAERFSALHRDAEVFSTNLAIAAEARSQISLDRLVHESRTLSQTITRLAQSTRDDLERIGQSGEQLQNTTHTAADSGKRCLSALTTWEELRLGLEQNRSALTNQMQRIRPATLSLGNDVRRLISELDQARQTLLSKQETVQALGESASAMSASTEEILRVLKIVGASDSIPPAPTRGLAETQLALESSLRNLVDLASDDGIEILSDDASAILEQIRQEATEAKERVLAAVQRKNQRQHPPAEPRA